MHPAWTVSQVSSRWRSAALSTPALWLEITLPFDTYTNSHPMTIVNSLSLFLPRSDRYTINVNITGKDEALRKHSAAIILLRDSSSYRWKVADIVIPYTHYRFLIPVNCHLPHLVSLSAILGDMPRHNDHIGLVYCPNGLVIHEVTTDQPTSVLHFFLPKRLKRYTYHHNPQNPGAHLFNLSLLHAGYLMSLEFLDLHVDNTSWMLVPVELPSLITLIVHGDADAIRTFTRILHVPALQIISLESNGHIEDVIKANTPLTEPCMFACPSPRVIVVMLDMQMVHKEVGKALGRLLAETPRLQYMELRLKGDIGNTSALYEALAVTDNVRVAPELALLVFWSFACIVVENAVAEATVQSRGGTFRLNHYRVQNSSLQRDSDCSLDVD